MDTIDKLTEIFRQFPGIGPRQAKRFVYYLLGATGICVVPLTSFATDLKGFRVTLLERNEEEFVRIFRTLAETIQKYMKS